MSSKLSDKDLLARLVAFDSVSANSNLPIVDFISEYLERPGVEFIRLTNDDGSKVNLLVWAGPTEVDENSRAGLILSGHVDVVPAGDLNEWQSDPFELTERDENYFARGSCDMKGFDALAINLLAEIVPAKLTAPLVLLFSFDEELGTLGAAHFIKHWPADKLLPRNAIIGEPTSLKAVRMHKGHLSMSATVHGQTAHTGSPHLGKNAIEPAAKIINALADLRKEFTELRCDTSEYFKEVPGPGLNVTTVMGGQAINVIPELCTIGFGLRILPGMDSDDLVGRIKETVKEAAVGCDFEFEVLNDSPPFCVSEDADIYKSICALVKQNQTIGVTFASDAGHLSKLGIDCVLFGPGAIEVAHKPNEYIPIDEFNKAKPMLEQLVQQFCVD